MKLNFWQWLGVVLLVVGVFWMVKRDKKPTPAPNNSTPPATTQAK